MKHIHRRKTHVTKKYKPNSLDRFIYVIAFAGPFMTIPQIYDTWIIRHSSVNQLTWGSYFVIGLVWLYYGIVHNERPIIFSNILGVITAGLVVLGAVIYG